MGLTARLIDVTEPNRGREGWRRKWSFTRPRKDHSAPQPAPGDPPVGPRSRRAGRWRISRPPAVSRDSAAATACRAAKSRGHRLPADAGLWRNHPGHRPPRQSRGQGGVSATFARSLRKGSRRSRSISAVRATVRPSARCGFSRRGSPNRSPWSARRRSLHRARPSLGDNPDRPGTGRQCERPCDRPICRADRHGSRNDRRNHGGSSLSLAGGVGELQAVQRPTRWMRGALASWALALAGAVAAWAATPVGPAWTADPEEQFLLDVNIRQLRLGRRRARLSDSGRHLRRLRRLSGDARPADEDRSSRRRKRAAGRSARKTGSKLTRRRERLAMATARRDWPKALCVKRPKAGASTPPR